MSEQKQDWTIEDADYLYRVSRWSEGYFQVGENGNLHVFPFKTPESSIDMSKVLEEMEKNYIQLPAVIRFQDILRTQLASINKVFQNTIEEAKFNGTYYGVYPIKVNQLREVVEEVVDAGNRYHVGLEAGSKAELLAVLANNTNINALTICNGYKDDDFLKLALLGRTLGRKIIVVIEKFNELPRLLKLAEELDVEPIIGIRAKLAAEGSGKWAHSGGEKAKFGLTIAEILKVVNLLKEKNKLECLQLFHFHIGSQITDIRSIKDAITEGARVFAKLAKMGVPIRYFDAGGGVGVDYEGAKATSNSSINYSLEDYAGDVVYILKEICDLEEVDHPNIVTETGRALTAYHSCIIFNVFDRTEYSENEPSVEKTAGEHVLVKNMRELVQDLTEDNYLDIYNDAIQKKNESIYAFNLGILGLDERARIETVYGQICRKIIQLTRDHEEVPEEIENLRIKLADLYYSNFSLFQSLPDAWAIDQVIPILPIQRLNEKPTRLGTLADITCDSDGHIDNFVSSEDCSKVLPLHAIEEGEKYPIGAFLTGAYQDVMGDLHNLFGRLNEVHIYFDREDPDNFYIEEVINGNTAEDVLSLMQYSPRMLAQTIKRALDKQVQRGKIRPRQAVKLTDFYESCLESYTYLAE